MQKDKKIADQKVEIRVLREILDSKLCQNHERKVQEEDELEMLRKEQKMYQQLQVEKLRKDLASANADLASTNAELDQQIELNMHLSGQNDKLRRQSLSNIFVSH